MFVIEGIKTSIRCIGASLRSGFAAGKIDTHFIERLLEQTGNSAYEPCAAGHST